MNKIMKFFSDGEMTWKTMDIKGGIQSKGVEGDKCSYTLDGITLECKGNIKIKRHDTNIFL